MGLKIILSQVKDYFVTLRSKPKLWPGFLLLGLIFLFLPGQNFYQTRPISWQKPKVQPLSLELPTPAPYPQKATNVSPPFLTAQSVVVIDIPSSVVIYAKNPNQTLSPASTTKIMTAIVALENYQLGDILTVKTAPQDGRLMGLQVGNQLTVEALLYGTLVHSGNDAAYALAENFPQGMENFIALMNEKAKELNMNNTHFNGVSGLEREKNYTSSIDLTRLSAYALAKPVFKKIVSTREITVIDATGQKKYFLENLNKLLGKVEGVSGVKTGWTENAGECLVALAERNGRQILTVVLKSEDRFLETEKLINWVFKNHQWITPAIGD